MESVRVQTYNIAGIVNLEVDVKPGYQKAFRLVQLLEMEHQWKFFPDKLVYNLTPQLYMEITWGEDNGSVTGYVKKESNIKELFNLKLSKTLNNPKKVDRNMERHFLPYV